MIDVGDKPTTRRRAVARARVHIADEVLARLEGGTMPKGDVLATARVAGIMAAKSTPQQHGPQLDPTDRRILRYLRKMPTRVKTPEIAKALNLNAKSIGKNLARLVKWQPPLLESIKRVGYVVTKDGRSIPM